jgi:enoyl-CoA hydratase/carnithine racemase
MKPLSALLAAACLWAGASHAQHSPKALSAEQVRQLLQGAGMGYAKAAELNRHPGPQHALELADKLGLTPEQVKATQALMAAHKAQARELGKKLVEAERALDALFRDGGGSEGGLQDAVRRTAQLEGEYRLSHLETHRRMRGLLTEEQVTRYDRLRGSPGANGHVGHSR